MYEILTFDLYLHLYSVHGVVIKYLMYLSSVLFNRYDHVYSIFINVDAFKRI